MHAAAAREGKRQTSHEIEFCLFLLLPQHSTSFKDLAVVSLFFARKRGEIAPALRARSFNCDIGILGRKPTEKKEERGR